MYSNVSDRVIPKRRGSYGAVLFSIFTVLVVAAGVRFVGERKLEQFRVAEPIVQAALETLECRFPT